jgi:hypothetical protein
LKVNGARIRGTERFDGFSRATRTSIVKSLLVIFGAVCETNLRYTLESQGELVYISRRNWTGAIDESI